MTTYVEIVSYGLIAQDFTDQVANRVVTSMHRGSTRKIYQSKWTKFTVWCRSKQVDPLTATEQQVAQFLWELFNQGLAVPTNGAYRSAISYALKYRGMDLTNSQVIGLMMRSFRIERPRYPNAVPQWNLRLVLSHLLEHPFQPMGVFSKEDKTGMILYPELNYLPKVLDAAERNRRFQPISIPVLTQMVGHDRQEPDRLLCPVRAVTQYINR
jgi:hypothetical protein